ncbi:MAG: hypothetical protein ABH872_00385 [Candidatus Omnitrophota bacterium]
MSKEKFTRRKYFINRSVQLRYIMMSVLPALIVAVVCTFIVVRTGEFTLSAASNRLSLEMTSFNRVLKNLVSEDVSRENVAKIVIQLKGELLSFNNALRSTYLDTLEEWRDTQLLVVSAVLLMLICVGVLSLLYSHRIVGPIYRIEKYIEMLAEDKDIPPVKIRSTDEFQHIAESLEKLRQRLKNKGA